MAAETFEYYELPKDFKPTFRKAYETNGVRFDVEVQNLGKVGIAVPRCQWLFSIIVNGHRVVNGPFNWDPKDRSLTDENVANRMASYWGYDHKVKAAQGLPNASEGKDAYSDTIAKCVEKMFACPFFAGDTSEYDILVTTFNEFGWSVVLMPNHKPERLYMFNSMGVGNPVDMWVYMRAYSRQYAPFTN